MKWLLIMLVCSCAGAQKKPPCAAKPPPCLTKPPPLTADEPTLSKPGDPNCTQDAKGSVRGCISGLDIKQLIGDFKAVKIYAEAAWENCNK